jgi:hypothetical protein
LYASEIASAWQFCKRGRLVCSEASVKATSQGTKNGYNRPVILLVISALGILNGGAGLVNMYLYLASNSSRQRLAITLLNISVFAFTLVYVSIRRERLRNFGEVTASPSSRSI